MKLPSLVACGVVAVAVLSTPAYAIPITDTFDPADVLFDDGVGPDAGGACTSTNDPDVVAGITNGKCTSLAYSHIVAGYGAGDTLLSATLTLYLYDDNSPGGDSTGTPEKFDLALDSVALVDGQLITTGSTSGSPYLAGFNVFAQVAPDGLLNVLLGWDQGDFYFQKSVLQAEFTEGGNNGSGSVPEPATLLVFGLGLAGYARSRRRAIAG